MQGLRAARVNNGYLGVAADVTCDPYFDNLVFALYGIGTNGAQPSTSDVGGIGLTWNGTAKITTSVSKFYGSCIDASGADKSSSLSTNAVYTAMSSFFAFGTGGFTIDCWALRTVGSGGHYPLVGLYDGSNNRAAVLMPPRVDGSQTQYQIGGLTGTCQLSSHALNVWEHYRMVRTEDGLCGIALNGARSEITGRDTTNFGNLWLTVGDTGGYVADLRIYNTDLPLDFEMPTHAALTSGRKHPSGIVTA